MKILLSLLTLLNCPAFAAIPIGSVLNDLELRSNGLLKLNQSMLDNSALSPLTAQPIFSNGQKLLLGKIEFQFDSEKNVYTPDMLVDPEQLQDLMSFDLQQFVKNQNAEDFLDAKWKYYRSLSYDFKLKTYRHPAPRLSDWMALNHPPVKKLQFSPQFYSKKSIPNKNKPSIRNTESFQHKIDLLSGSELTSGNQIQFLNNSEVSSSRIEIAKSAKRTLWGSTLLIVCDAGTQPLIDILAEKAKQGVDVRIIVDRFMQSIQSGSCEKTLQSLGIKVLQVHGMITHLSAFHMKMWIADLDRAQIEGMNMIDAQTLSTGFNHLYRDSGLSIQGPLVTDTYSKYIEFWNQYDAHEIPESFTTVLDQQRTLETKAKIRGTENYSEWLRTENQTLCRLVEQDRKSVIDRISPVYLEYLKSANQQIISASVRRGFHHVMKERGWHNLLLAELIKKARDEQIPVELMVNSDQGVFTMYDIPNSGLSTDARKNLFTSIMRLQRNFSQAQSILSGSRFFEEVASDTTHFRAWSYFNFNHLKLSLIDTDTVITGSYNLFTPRSNRDAELVVICQSSKLGREVSNQLILDLSNSTPFPFWSQK